MPISARCRGEASGILDSTGIAHLLGEGEPELAGLAGQRPLLDGSRLAMLGCDPREQTEAGRAFLAARGVSFAEGPELAADPAGAARRALAALGGADPIVVHFDVDVVDSGDLPLGNFRTTTPASGSTTRPGACASCWPIRPVPGWS